MKVLGKDIGFRRWNYGVEWIDKGQRRLKHFTTEPQARAFFEKRRRNFASPTLFRFRPDSLLDRVLATELVWHRYHFKLRAWPVLFFVALVLCAFNHWRNS